MTAVRRHPKVALAVVAVIALAALYFSGLLPSFDAKHFVERLARALGPWTYALVGVLAFLETGAFVGLVAPGETAVIVAGVIAGQGEIELIPLIGLVWVCAVLGDTTSYFVGRRLGRDFILRHGPRVKIDEARLKTVEVYFERHGGKTILVGRFVGLVRALAPFVVGSSGVPYRRFLPFSVIGCGLWSTLFCVLGFVFWRSFDRVASIAGKATFSFGVLVFAVVASIYLHRRLSTPAARRSTLAWLDRQADRPVIGPLWRRLVRPAATALVPRLRFVSDRFTPGDLGLELTTTVAATAVGAYVFALYASLLGGGAEFTPADRRLLRIADDLRVGLMTDVMKLVTELGTLLSVGAFLIVLCAVLAVRRVWTDLVALVAGAVLLVVAVQLAKHGIDRPRPPGPLVATDGSSFPSGHAAYATLWVAMAVVASRALPGLVGRAALVGSALALCVAIGLSRVYLHVHYWSDVAAGWGLGAATLGLVATVAMIVGFVRQTDAQPN